MSNILNKILGLTPLDDNKMEWSYIPNSDIYVQTDWNNTILTDINRISAKIFKTTLRGGANTIIVNPKLKPLISGINYYRCNDTNDIIGGRFKIIYDENQESNKISVLNSGGSIIHEHGSDILVFLPQYGVDNNGMGSFEWTKLSDNEVEVNEYLRGLVGEIIITNITDEDLEREKMQREIENEDRLSDEADEFRKMVKKCVKYGIPLTPELQKRTIETEITEIKEENLVKDITKEEVFSKIEDVLGDKAICFYFEKYNREIKEVDGVFGDYFPRTLMLNPNQKEESLKLMSEIESKPNFSHWSGPNDSLKLDGENDNIIEYLNSRHLP